MIFIHLFEYNLKNPIKSLSVKCFVTKLILNQIVITKLSPFKSMILLPIILCSVYNQKRIHSHLCKFIPK